MSGPRAADRTLPDAEARRRIVEDLDTTLFVEAAAGTGKTTALVGRLTALLASGRAPLDEVVALTFSERAAAEMKLRLRTEIERAREAPGSDAATRARLEASLERLEVARIDTIHAFCADLLREYPLAAGVDPLFEVTADEEGEALLRQAFAAWFERVLEAPPPGVQRVLRRRSGGQAASPREQLLGAARQLVEQRDFDAAWRRDPFDREAALDAALETLEGIAALGADAQYPDDWLAKGVADIARFCDELALQERVRGRDHDALEAALRGFVRRHRWNWVGRPRRDFSPGHTRDQVIALRAAAKEELERVLLACEADLAPLLREELREVVEAYEVAKQRAGKLDFLDLLLRARNLVRDETAVRRELQQRFRYFFVDEFQDTDPLQVELLLLLAAEDARATDARAARTTPGKLFIVGDPKQSIYRFRRADIAIYRDVMRRLCAQGAERLYLSSSFRGVASIQAAVNAAFAPLMSQASSEAPDSQAEYTPLDRVRDDLPDQPAIVALPVPAPYSDWGKLTQWSVQQSYPDAVGAFIDWLCNQSGWQVDEEDPLRPGERRRVAIEARHVCVLFRRLKRFRDDVTRDYVRALEVRRIPHVLLGGRSFHEREEVLALRNALFAIEWPDDALRVYAALRGPLFALGDDQLLAFRHRHGALHPLRRFETRPPAAGEGGGPDQTGGGGSARSRAAGGGVFEDWEREVIEALELLARLHVGRNHRSVAETLGRLLGALRAHAGIAIWPTGEQALANCMRVVDLARRFERRTARSFRAFVEYLEEQAESGEAQDAPVVEDGSDGVRLMTVHKAKGLEFPVVILADPTCRATHERPDRTSDAARASFAQVLCGCAPAELLERSDEERRRDRDEAQRVAYVAATRARDLLVVPVVGDARGGLTGLESGEFWLDGLAPALFPGAELRRDASPPPAAWGVPALGDDSVWLRPDQAPRSPEASVRPGVHAPMAGSHHVLWWGPKALALDKRENVGLRQQKILHADAQGPGGAERVAQSARAHEDWQRERQAVLAAGAEGTLAVRAVTSAVRERLGVPGPGASPAIPGDSGVASGAAMSTGAELATDALAASRAELAGGQAPASSAEVVVERVERSPAERAARPGGRRFGTLVHAILAELPFAADPETVRAHAHANGRLTGATAAEVEAATGTVIAALAHPLLQRAQACTQPGDLHRESPLWLRGEDGSLYEGIVDLAFRERATDGRALWHVIDFKTDADLGAHRGEYERQVQLYAEAIARATGEEARAILLQL